MKLLETATATADIYNAAAAKLHSSPSGDMFYVE